MSLRWIAPLVHPSQCCTLTYRLREGFTPPGRNDVDAIKGFDARKLMRNVSREVATMSFFSFPYFISLKFGDDILVIFAISLQLSQVPGWCHHQAELLIIMWQPLAHWKRAQVLSNYQGPWILESPLDMDLTRRRGTGRPYWLPLVSWSMLWGNDAVGVSNGVLDNDARTKHCECMKAFVPRSRLH